MGLRRDQDATGQVLGFLLAGALFVASLGGLLFWANGSAPSSRGIEQASQEVDAEGLASLLAESPGQGWATPDQLARLGLLDAAGQGIDLAHLDLMRNGSLEQALANGYLDYPEALASFGLTDHSGFHLRITPIGVEQALQNYDFSHQKVLYLGDFTPLSTITLSTQNGTIAGANARLNASQSTSALWEREVLDAIGVEFDNEVHLTLGSPTILVQVTTIPDVKTPLLTYLGGLTFWDGDVLFDHKQTLDGVLPGKLATGGYDLMVIGAGIDHNTLTSNAVKGAIDTWVRAGGVLMVFGAQGANYNWMQPIFSVTADTSSGAPSAPDPTHDLLDTPWDLDWANYNNEGLTWGEATPSAFEHVLQQGGEDILAISRPGTVGAGAVFLSSLKSSTIGAALGSTEAQHLMFNMLLYHLGPTESIAFFEYGPDPPLGEPVSAAVRTVNIATDSLGLVPARLELFVWGTAAA